MVTLTPSAVAKIKEFIEKNVDPRAAGLRVGVQGGGCSGFSYKLVLVTEAEIQADWNRFEFEGLAVFVDNMSAMYLDGILIDYVERVDGSGFKFENPNVKTTCGCGASFSA